MTSFHIGESQKSDEVVDVEGGGGYKGSLAAGELPFPPMNRRVVSNRVIDSRSRDSSVYATPSRYEVHLFNVAGVRLAVPDLPLPAYLVGATRRSVLFSFDGGATELTVSAEVQGSWTHDAGARARV
jgi:hypothetical protein